MNDFNRFGRTYQVIAQADAQFRSTAEDIAHAARRATRAARWCRSARFVNVTRNVTAPIACMRYNGYPAPRSTAAPRPAISSGQAEAAMDDSSRDENLPNGMTFEWTELTYQRILAGNTAVTSSRCACCSCSSCSPRSTRASAAAGDHPDRADVAALRAIIGVLITGGDNNIFTQIGLIVLVGLACKNAILIVEFAQKREAGRSAAAGRASKPRACACARS